MRVETALNHLTIIELSEPITMVAAGSPAFKIERRENKVFIQPLEEGKALISSSGLPRAAIAMNWPRRATSVRCTLPSTIETPVARDDSAAEPKTDPAEAAVNTLIRSVPVRWEGPRAGREAGTDDSSKTC